MWIGLHLDVNLIRIEKQQAATEIDNAIQIITETERQIMN